MKCTRIGERRCNCSCFEIDQEMDAIVLIIGIVYGECRIVIWPGPDVSKHGFRGKHMHFVLLIIPIFLSFSVFNSPLRQYVGYAPGRLG